MTDLDRRSFLKRSAAVSAGTAVLGGPFAGFVAGGGQASARRPAVGPLTPVPDLADGVVRLALPDGFAYRSFQASSKAVPLVLDDGSRLPGRHDGMAAFGRRSRDDDMRNDRRRDWHDDDQPVTLVRNHEENGTGPAFGAAGSPVYDAMAPGGTSTVRVSLQGQVAESFASLSGTQMNCSGGPMPWGAWVTCEETVNGPDVYDDFTRGSAPPQTYIVNRNLQKPHGFIYEVPTRGDASAEPIRHAGRFPHESVAFDPRAGELYLSEDNFAFPSGFYRYVPPRHGKHPNSVSGLRDGGRLFMLKVVGQGNADLARHQQPGTSYRVEWVEIDEPYFDGGPPPVGGTPSVTNDEGLQFVSGQGLAKGAAKFSRLEGTVYDHGWVYFTSTQGGLDTALTQPDSTNGFGKGFGQIWGYEIHRRRLHLLFESPNRDVLDFPDNVTTSPRGTIVICEDHDQLNFLRGLTRHGELFDIAQNVIAGRTSDEFAGTTFSPRGSTLFVNIQASSGLSFAIWGPWHKIGV